MYQVFLKNLLGFERIFENDVRLNLAKPFFLLANIESFNYHKQNNTPEYHNLFKIILTAQTLKTDVKYHGFGMFLNELHLQFFDFTLPESPENIPEQDFIEDQVSLLHQFMFPAYYN